MAMTHRLEPFPAPRRPRKLSVRRRQPHDYDMLLRKVRNLILARSEVAQTRRWATVEEVSETLGARHGDVQKAFYQLVREGLLCRAENVGPHDSTRDSFFRQPPGQPKRGSSGWVATRWPFRNKPTA